jgi:site-specific DNA recombinase
LRMRIGNGNRGRRVHANGPTNLAVIYTRVSSKEQEQGYSIPAQQELLRRYAADHGLMIEQEFMDIESAKSSGRPGFAAMVRLLQQRPECRAVLVEKTDRLYRNLKDYITMDELDVEIHMVKEHEILSRSSRSAQKFMHGIRVLMAKNYIDNLSEEVRKGLHMKAAQRLWPSFAPPGYCNAAGDGGKRIIVPDPVLGPVVARLFEWFATGNFSLKTVAKKAYEEGFRFRKSGNKIPIATLHKILRKRIYTGDFDYAGVTYHGSHEPLVSHEVWEQVQEILNGRKANGLRKPKPAFVYSGLLRCGHCGCSLVAEVKKGKYMYYHCTGYRGKCDEPYTREEVLDQRFSSALRELVVPATALDWLKNELLKSDQTERAARAQVQRRHQAELAELHRRLNVLYEDRLDARIDVETYDAKAARIERQQDILRQKTRDAAVAAGAPAEEAVNFLVGISEAAASYADLEPANRRDLLRLVSDEASWKEGELRMSFKKPFADLRLSNSASVCVSSSLAAREPNFDNWRRGGDSNSRYP